jgi:hypothetical protein
MPPQAARQATTKSNKNNDLNVKYPLQQAAPTKNARFRGRFGRPVPMNFHSKNN